MKVTDLMIGDYVNTPKGNYKVTTIQDNDVIFTDYADDIDGACDIDKVAPIPITKEIMDKNNLKYGDYCPFLDALDDKLVTQFGMRYKDGHFYIKDCFIEKIEFVHELQHFLRLLKINKEIVI